MIKYNLGSGPKQIEGYVNVDVSAWNGVTDIVWDLLNVPYEFAKEPVDEILAMEILEHLPFRLTIKVLKEWLRILKPGGQLSIQVPDCGKMMEYYANRLICDCVPHKAPDWDSYSADEWCIKCGGKAKVNPARWLYSFTGVQKHKDDFHKNIFTKESLQQNLLEVGFDNITFKDNPYKLIVNCFKPNVQ